MKLGSKLSVFAACAAVLSMSTAAFAADLPVQTQKPHPMVVDDGVGPWQIRLRELSVIPMDYGSVRAPSLRSKGLGFLSGHGVGFSNSIIPELDISYYFTKNIAAELILGTTKTTVSGVGDKMKALGMNRKLGSVWLLPPTLTMQYHFTNFGKFQPYVGAGVNYTFMYNEHSWGLRDFTVDSNIGGAAQIGFDYMFTKHWGFNVDAKKMWMKTSYHGKIGPHSSAATSTLAGTRIEGRVNPNPWLIGSGITYRF